MEYYSVLLPLALIMALSKILLKVCQRFHLPQVVGMLLAGLLIGFISFIPGQQILTDTALEGIGFIAKIGVILIMFTAGLETDISQIKKIGLPSVVITLAGVIFPLAFGFIVACLFNGGFSTGRDQMLSNLFYGVILTATSVSVTVATLKEMGKLSSKVGTTVVAAAIIDDIIGIVVLSFVVALKGDNGEAENPWTVLLKTLLFFVTMIIFGICADKGFGIIEKRWPHHRMLPIFSIALCFFFAYISEKLFGVADITGAYIAGLVLSSNPESNYIDRRSDIMGYLIFTPVFFANIGISTKLAGISGGMIAFGICFIIAGLLGKVIGCASAAIFCKYSFMDSVRVGLGMMARAEVCLVCAQKGAEHGMISSDIMPFIVLLIIISSFVTPICLKATYKGKKEKDKAAAAE